MSEKAVVDRIVEGKYVVLLVGEQEEERIVPLSQLEFDLEQGMFLEVENEGDQLHVIKILEEKREEITKRIANKMELLRQRGSKLKKND